MSDIKFTVNVDEYLSLNKYEVDESNAHIELVDDPSDAEFDKLIRVCPAALYKRDEDGNKSFDYAGCLECGTCRVACGDTIIKKWENPQPTMGVGKRCSCVKAPTRPLRFAASFQKHASRFKVPTWPYCVLQSRFGSAVHALKGDADAFYPHARGLPRGVCAPKQR